MHHPKITGAFAIGLVTAVAVYWGVHTHRVHQHLAHELSTLERQVALLEQALEVTGETQSAHTKELQEIADSQAQIEQSDEQKLTDAVAAATPAVVSLVVARDVALVEVEYVNPFGDDPMFRDVNIRVPRYRQVGTERQQVGAGTGFIVHPEGYLVTNRHVVDDPRATYIALLASGEEREARVIYRDPVFDLAVLQIDGNNLPTLPLAVQQELRLGQTVAAIGNALGEYSNSVSVGIVSGLNRTIQARDATGRISQIRNVIQTDAAINQGNSGGPLINLRGEAVGVNVATEYGANDIAFAIPVSAVREVLTAALPR